MLLYIVQAEEPLPFPPRTKNDGKYRKKLYTISENLINSSLCDHVFSLQGGFVTHFIHNVTIYCFGTYGKQLFVGQSVH